jgi:hypothetical protein
MASITGGTSGIGARVHAAARGELARRPSMSVLRGADPFAPRPSTTAYDRARKRFNERVDEYERELREWLTGYRRLAWNAPRARGEGTR